MASGNGYSELLTHLSKQPDAEGVIQQLQKEHSLFEEILDQGGEFDLDGLNTKVWKMLEGLSLMPPSELDSRLLFIEDLHAKVKASSQLAAIQDRPSLITDMLDHLSQAQQIALLAYASALESPLNRLELNHKIQISEVNSHEHIARQHSFETNSDTAGKFHETLAWLCSAVGIDPKVELEKGIVKEEIQLQQIELEKQINELRATYGIESIWDYLPIVSSFRTKQKDKQFAQIQQLASQSQLLQNKLELADSINKARQFILAEHPITKT